jgi:hypothetical protein
LPNGAKNALRCWQHASTVDFCTQRDSSSILIWQQRGFFFVHDRLLIITDYQRLSTIINDNQHGMIAASWGPRRAVCAAAALCPSVWQCAYQACCAYCAYCAYQAFENHKTISGNPEMVSFVADELMDDSLPYESASASDAIIAQTCWR